MDFTRDQYMSNNVNSNKFISPPISPKQYFELNFQHYNPSNQRFPQQVDQAMERKDIENDWIPVESFPPSPPSTSYSIKTYGKTSQEKQRVLTANQSPLSGTVSTRRKQSKPIPSLPSSTSGAFQMPFVAHNGLTRDYRTSISFISPQQTSSSLSLPSFHNLIDVTSKKRKRRNDCATENSTMCLASINSQQINKQKEKESSKSVRDCMSIYALLDEEPSSEQVHNADQQPLETQLLNDNKKQDADKPEDSASSADDDGRIITSKKAKTDAALVYDNLSADSDQSILFRNSEEWIPSLEVFNRRPTVRISWKGSPLKIKNMPHFEKLHPGEATIAATLRLTPEQYLKCKWALVLAAKEAYETNSMFRKSEAQKVCCIDVNKTSVLWNAFGKLGWLGSKWPQ